MTDAPARANEAAEMTRRTYFAGVRDGDLEIIERYFAQPHVRARMDDWNERLLDGTTYGRDAWDETALDGHFVFKAIVTHGHVELLAWFLAQERLWAPLRTLVQRLAFTILEESSAAAREMFEMVVSSSMYVSTWSDQAHDDLLAEVLRKAASTGRNAWLEPLLAHGASMTYVTRVSPLHAATEGGDAQTVRCLIANGATVNPSDLVTQSVWEGNIGVLCELLRVGADPRSATMGTNAALALARELGMTSMAEILEWVG